MFSVCGVKRGNLQPGGVPAALSPWQPHAQRCPWADETLGMLLASGTLQQHPRPCSSLFWEHGWCWRLLPKRVPGQGETQCLETAKVLHVRAAWQLVALVSWGLPASSDFPGRSARALLSYQRGLLLRDGPAELCVHLGKDVPICLAKGMGCGQAALCSSHLPAPQPPLLFLCPPFSFYLCLVSGPSLDREAGSASAFSFTLFMEVVVLQLFGFQALEENLQQQGFDCHFLPGEKCFACFRCY